MVFDQQSDSPRVYFQPDFTTPRNRHNGNDSICVNCRCAGYKTARKPWRHYHNHSTYCDD